MGHELLQMTRPVLCRVKISVGYYNCHGVQLLLPLRVYLVSHPFFRAMGILCLCASSCKMVRLMRNRPPTALQHGAWQLFDEDVLTAT